LIVDAEKAEFADIPIDYVKVTKKLNALKENSMKYLTSALK